MPIADDAVVETTLLSGIDAGCSHFSELKSWVRRVFIESELRLSPNRPDYRTVDRGLQALRRQGVITYNSKSGWKRASDPSLETD